MIYQSCLHLYYTSIVLVSDLLIPDSNLKFWSSLCFIYCCGLVRVTLKIFLRKKRNKKISL